MKKILLTLTLITGLFSSVLAQNESKKITEYKVITIVDDKNGYIDDVHGWNFLGNANGSNANAAQLEVTRTLVRLNKKFEGRELKDICGEELAEYTKYLEVKQKVEGNVARAQQRKAAFFG